jgi:protein-S-isoprenylcysteine O-methyltransferase Ste14
MNAPALVFRFRVFIFVLLYFVGFFPPWDFRSGSRGTLWLAASTLLARTGWIGLATATLAVTLAALACLVAGTILRVYGTAYIGSGVMSGFAMQGDVFVASGPYRYVRNPLYLGAWLLALGVSILMPPSGAAFFLLAFSVFVLILISAEERFLSAKQGDLYQQYLRRVPRLLPRMAAGSATSSARPQWVRALFAETYPIAITLCFAVVAWRYNARILIRCVLICYGLSLVVRAITKRPMADTKANSV